jgi:hypothetical protein
MIFKKFTTFQSLSNSTKIALAIITIAFTLCYGIQAAEVHGSQKIINESSTECGLTLLYGDHIYL